MRENACCPFKIKKFHQRARGVGPRGNWSRARRPSIKIRSMARILRSCGTGPRHVNRRHSAKFFHDRERSPAKKCFYVRVSTRRIIGVRPLRESCHSLGFSRSWRLHDKYVCVRVYMPVMVSSMYQLVISYAINF